MAEIDKTDIFYLTSSVGGHPAHFKSVLLNE